MTTRPPSRTVAAAVLVAALGMAAACASGEATPAPAGSTVSSAAVSSAPVTTAPAVQRITIGYAGGAVAGDTGRVAVPLGAAVEIVVTSDVAEELHLHGYDRSAKIPAGGSATLSFTATLAGVYELELHGADKELVKLQVG